MRSGRRPCLRTRFASFAAVVVLPEPCRPARTMTVGGRSALTSGVAVPPSISTIASWTIFTTCCAPVIDSRTFAPRRRERTVATGWRTTFRLTPASSSAPRTSRSASSRSVSVTRGRPRRRSNVPASRSESCSNISPGRRSRRSPRSPDRRGCRLEERTSPEPSAYRTRMTRAAAASQGRRSPLRSADQRLQLTWRDLGTVEVTLDDLDAERREGRFLLDRLDGVGDDTRADLLRFRDERADPVRVHCVVAGGREWDLERVELQLATRPRAARVFLGRQAHPECSDGHQRFDERLVCGGPAGTLELDGLRIGPGFRDGVHEPQRIRAPKRLGPYVRGDDGDGDPLFPPLLRLAADGPDDPAIELDMHSGLVDQRDDVARADHSVGRVGPAHERLDARELARRDRDLRLIVERKRAGLERLFEIRAP